MARFGGSNYNLLNLSHLNWHNKGYSTRLIKMSLNYNFGVAKVKLMEKVYY